MMYVRGGVLLASALMIAACSGSDSSHESEVSRGAAGVAPVINGCVLEPNTQCPGVNLSRQDLSGMDGQGKLTGINLRGANLSNADLSGATFFETDLRGANLNGANLAGADLENAYFYDTDIGNTNICQTTMPGGEIWNDDC